MVHAHLDVLVEKCEVQTINLEKCKSYNQACVGTRGVVGREHVETASHTFFRFCFKMSLKLFENG